MSAAASYATARSLAHDSGNHENVDSVSAQYNDAEPPAGPRNMALIIGKSLRLEGFIVSNHFDMLPAYLKDLSGWIAGGKIKWKETVEVGIENAPTAFIKLFKGENIGKMLVKLG